jgi:hypothetical protein
MGMHWTLAVVCGVVGCGAAVDEDGVDGSGSSSEATTNESSSTPPTTSSDSTSTEPLDASTSTDTSSDSGESSSSGDPPPSDDLGQFGYTPVPLGIFADDVIIEDFDGDGHQDLFTQLAAGGRDHTLQVHLGNGVEPLVFDSAPSSVIPWGWWTAAGDFDGEASLDVVASASGLEELLIMALADAESVFASSTMTAAESYFAEFGIAVLDVDGDGLDDVFVPNGHSEGASVHRSDGMGSVAHLGDVMAPACYFSDSVVADFDGDGYDDVAATGSCNAIPEMLPLVVYRGDGSQLSVGQTIYEGPGVLEGGKVVAVDLDDDGDMDVVTGIGLRGAGMTVLENDGGTLGSPSARAFDWDGYAFRIAAARIDAAMPIAFVVQSDFDTGAVVEQGDPWSATPILLPGWLVGGADFDEDGRTDIVTVVDDEVVVWVSGG